MKICTKCHQELPDSEFRIESRRSWNPESREGIGIIRDYSRSACKECERKVNRQKILAYKTAPPKPDFCECCHTADRKLVLDHDHITGQFRGWICGNCNKGIGNLGDNVNGLEMAIKYLNGETKSSNPLMEMLVIT